MDGVAPRATAGHNIGDLLLREGLITETQLDGALARQRESDQPLLRILVESGYLDETKRLNFFKRQFAVPVVTLSNVKIDPLLYTYIPPNVARRHHLVPVKLDRDGLVVAMEDPSDLLLLDNLKEIVGLRIKPVVATSTDIQEALKGYPEERVEEVIFLPPDQPDPAVRTFSFLFLPLMSGLALLAIFLLILFVPPVQSWVRETIGMDAAETKSSQMFNLFLYFFLSWGIYTIVMYEVQGLVFEDFEWRAVDEVGEPKKWTTALVLSVLLGWLGADRLYLKYTRAGILKLLTLGLFGIWWIFDIVLILGRKIPDAAGRELV